MSEQKGRDDWLRSRVYQLEDALQKVIEACGCDNPDDRNYRLTEALRRMPE